MQNLPSNQNYGADTQMGARGKSALGMEGNVAAAVGYIIGILALIMIFIEKDNRFVKFHAIQSVLYAVMLTVLMIVLTVLSTIIGLALAAVSESLAFIVGLLIMVLFFGLGLAMLAGLIFAAYKAYQGQMFKLPIVGNFAERFASK